MRAFIVAGTHSGCGKTTLTLALMQHFANAGMGVAPFKAGPDFIDPIWHRAACGRTSYNLDAWMMSAEHIAHLLARAHGLRVVEGVMGLFDGKQGVGGEGSTQALAELTGLPVVLIVDAGGMAGSLVPLIEGFVRRCPGIIGVIANRVGGRDHAGMLADLLKQHDLPPLLGWMAADAPKIPERHLGLYLPGRASLPDWSAHLHLDDKRLLALLDAHAVKPAPETEGSRQGGLLLHGCRIAVARDQAFCFIYPANLDWLKGQGAKLRFFSPLAGDPVPAGTDALWLPGGYPELYAEKLAASSSWDSVRGFIEAGGPALAECGGVIALSEALIDASGRRYPMAGVLPCITRMHKRLAGLGYRRARLAGQWLAGHEFHYFSYEPTAPLPPAFAMEAGDGGMRYKCLRAAYHHWYFPSAAHAAASLFAEGA